MTGVSFPVSHHTSQNNQKSWRGETEEGLLLCMFGWASDKVREIMAALSGSSVKRHPVGSEFASSRPCMCWQSAELSPSEYSWLRWKACVCVRLDKATHPAASVSAWQHAFPWSPPEHCTPLSSALHFKLIWETNNLLACKRVATKFSFSHLVPV